ncbi:DUF7853 family protein [Natrialbaceae archaeon A-gly3]
MTLRNTREQVTFSREQQWVAHHVMLDRIELEAKAPGETEPPPMEVFQVFEKLEAGEPRLTSSERRCLCRELRRYVEGVNTPERDESVARTLLESLAE